MIRILFTAVIIMFCPVAVKAQSKDYLALLSARSVSNGFSQSLLRDDYWTRLRKDETFSIEELSVLRVAYDPDASPRLTAGAAYFIGAEVVRRLRAVNETTEEILARILEYRIRWLAGDLDTAHFQAADLVTQIGAIGLPDSYVMPVLVDVAMLSWRRDDASAAEAYLDRARACANGACAPDVIAALFKRIRKSDDPVSLKKIANDLRKSAVEDAPILFSESETVTRDIDLAHRFATGAMDAELERVLKLANEAADPSEVSAEDRRLMRMLAERWTTQHDFMGYQMRRNSVAGVWRSANVDLRRNLSKLIEQTSYLGNPLISALPGQVATLIALLRLSDRDGDDVIADVLFARRLMVEGEEARAASVLRTMLADAKIQGLSDAELYSAWMDLWALGQILEDDMLTEQAFEATTACRAKFCEEDLVIRFFQDIEALQVWNRSAAAMRLGRAQSERFIRATWPGDTLKLADLYETGPGRQSQPISAARDAELSLIYAESAVNIDPEDLVRRAAKAMDTQVYAGRYETALAMGDRISERLADLPQLLSSGRFWQVRARAAFRIGDPSAREYYQLALEAGGWSALELDLLDTPYLDLAARAATKPAVLSRIRARQGRHAEAAGLLNTPKMAKRFGSQFIQNLIRDIDPKRLSNEMIATALAELDTLDLTQPLYRDSTELTATYYQIAKYLADSGNEHAIDMIKRSTEIEAQVWEGLGDGLDLESLKRLQSTRDSSYDIIRWIIELRDEGSYDGAAFVMRRYAWLARAAIANGSYTDAQTLWQMAFTFARVGESGIAFDLMDEAARIAATLSFKNAEGSDGGSLQLLERDRWRYLLFVDIAWAAASGAAPQDMLVVSRY